MKLTKLYMGIFFFVVPLLFSGCSRELDDIPEILIPESSEEIGYTESDVLCFRVNEVKYYNRKSGSRTVDNGVTTLFKEGDKIGLFVVDMENHSLLYENIPVSKVGDRWTANQNIRVKDYPVRIFAYYPYVSDTKIIDKINPMADNAAVFFQKYIEEIDIAEQYTESLYRQSDILACMETIEGKDDARNPLDLNMFHQMKLIVISSIPETGESSISLNTDPSYFWPTGEYKTVVDYSYIVDGVSFKPYIYNGKRYILLKPSTTNFFGSFTENGVKKNYTLNVSFSCGEYRSYRINPNIFTIEVGDFFLKDGSLRKKDSQLTEEEKNNCVGVVFWSSTEDDPLSEHSATWLEDHPNCTHGLVVSLTHHLYTKWGTIGEVTGTIDTADDIIFRGYANTKLLKIHPEYAIVTVYNNLRKISLPVNKTTDWYIPSVAELMKLSNKFNNTCDMVNTSLGVLGQPLATQIVPSGYWSSSESDANNAYNAALIAPVVGTLRKNTGDSFYLSSVRLIFAF